MCDYIAHVLQHNFDKRMEVKNSYMPLSCFSHVSYSTAHAEPKCESLITRESSALDSRGRGVECEYSGTRTREGASYYSTRSSGSANGGGVRTISRALRNRDARPSRTVSSRVPTALEQLCLVCWSLASCLVWKLEFSLARLEFFSSGNRLQYLILDLTLFRF